MIQRIFFLILIPFLSLSIVSCDDLEDNTPALQVTINGELFKASDIHIAFEENQGYTIIGANETSVLTIYLTNINEGSHVFGEHSDNKVTYSNQQGTFTTAINKGGGEFVLTDKGMWSEGGVLDYVTGTFYFTALNNNGVRMQGVNGNAYQVPFGVGEFELPGTENDDILLN